MRKFLIILAIIFLLLLPFGVNQQINIFTLGDSNSDINWNRLQNYPSGCGVGQAVQIIGDTLTCISIAGSVSIDLNAYLDKNKYDSNINSFLRRDNNWSGRNDFNAVNGLQSMDGNFYDDLNVFDKLTIEGTIGRGIFYTVGTDQNTLDINMVLRGAVAFPPTQAVRYGPKDVFIGTQNTSTLSRIGFITSIGSSFMTYNGTSFVFNDDVTPSSSGGFALGSLTALWAGIFTDTMSCVGNCIISTRSATDQNVQILNEGLAGSNLVIKDGNIYDENHLYVEKTSNLKGLVRFDSNMQGRDENNSWIINSQMMIGDANQGTSGNTLATNTGNALGATFTCLRAILIDGNVTTCSDIGGTRNIWAKVN